MSEYSYDLGIPSDAPIPKASENESAQEWFARGYSWAAGFHREESSYCFEEAVKADPDCVLGYWGIAICNGPDYNFNESGGFFAMANQDKTWPSFKWAFDAVNKAVELCKQGKGLVAPGHQEMLETLAMRYCWPLTDDAPGLKVPYAKAMAEIVERFPDNIEVLIQAAEAQLCLRPWDLYDNKTSIYAIPVLNDVGQKVKQVVNAGLGLAPKNHWLCHLKIHLNEMGPVDEFDWKSANVLRNEGTALSGHGHLLHMPTHLDMQVGAYADAMKWNVNAYQKDKELSKTSTRRTLWIGYMIHNMEFCAWAAMYAGHKATALTAARELVDALPNVLFEGNPMAAMIFESYTTLNVMVHVRFGMWDDILQLPFKEKDDIHIMHNLFLRFGRGVARGAKGEIAEAKKEQDEFKKLLGTLKKGDRKKHVIDGVDMAEIAECILAGEVLYRENQFEKCFSVLREAIQKSDDLKYDEPAGWLMSARQTLAALLTEQKHYFEACTLYHEDLVVYPKNIWSLAGLKICFEARSDPRLVDIERQYNEASKQADISIGASCACALTHFEGPHNNKPQCCL